MDVISAFVMLAAIAQNNCEMLRALARNNGGNLSSIFRDEKGQNMLMIAVNSASRECLASLLQNGAKVNINEMDSVGNTALMHAAKNGDTASLYLLLAYTADTSLKNKAGHAAYDLAVQAARNNEGARVCMELLSPYRAQESRSDRKDIFEIVSEGYTDDETDMEIWEEEEAVLIADLSREQGVGEGYTDDETDMEISEEEEAALIADLSSDPSVDSLFFFDLS